MNNYLNNIDFLVLAFILLSGFVYYLFNELEDECVRDTWKKNRNFLNNNLSWKNKWKLDDQGNLQLESKKWYYFGLTPKYKERFFLSSTVLVFVTDGEHLFQAGKNTAIALGFLAICWQFAIAFIIGRYLMGFIKEAFLKNIQ